MYELSRSRDGNDGCVGCCTNIRPASTMLDTTMSTETPSGRLSCRENILDMNEPNISYIFVFHYLTLLKREQV